MTRDKVVVDASVALKWFLPPEEEADLVSANALLQAAASGAVRMVQPPHFLAEVAAVLARRSPDTTDRDLALLRLVDWEAAREDELYSDAMSLSAQLGEHLFDTLYHATARTEGAEVVTADLRYLRSAKSLGGIRALSEWTPPD